MTQAIVSYDTDGPVAMITMDDGRANALGPDLTQAINDALDQAEADETVKAAVIAGREGRFSAGFDLSIISGGDAAAIRAMVSAGGSLVQRLYGGPLPVVAACTGHAVAAGALMLLGCDVRVGPDAPVKIGLNEVGIGLTLPGWALTIASERLSFRHRQRAVVNAVLYDGAGAVDVGFLDRVVAPDQVLAEAVAEATILAELDA
ncbi:MAG: crotonase/enoyl-CoA hydratase family protein, partial [Actinomycetia bacterium]|nr:crotonase/enoyl-CoA hydratase family protein [Actinomycetes bacterium]